MNIKFLTSYRTRMTIGFLLVIMLALIVALAIADRQVGRVIGRDVLQLSSDAAARFNYDIDSYVEQLAESAAPLAAGELLQHFLRVREAAKPEETVAIEKELR